MSAPAFTPGPWQVVPATEHHGFYVTSDFGNTLFDLYTMSNPLHASTANGGDSKPVPFMHEMDGPNASLIAAAPDLYEALDWLVTALKTGTMYNTPGLIERAEIALAKAVQS